MSAQIKLSRPDGEFSRWQTIQFFSLWSNVFVFTLFLSSFSSKDKRFKCANARLCGGRGTCITRYKKNINLLQIFVTKKIGPAAAASKRSRRDQGTFPGLWVFWSCLYLRIPCLSPKFSRCAMSWTTPSENYILLCQFSSTFVDLYLLNDYIFFDDRKSSSKSFLLPEKVLHLDVDILI
jgi:hypothetical protein